MCKGRMIWQGPQYPKFPRCGRRGRVRGRGGGIVGT